MKKRCIEVKEDEQSVKRSKSSSLCDEEAKEQTFQICYSDCTKKVFLPVPIYKVFIIALMEADDNGVITLCISKNQTCGAECYTPMFHELENFEYLKNPVDRIPYLADYLHQFKQVLSFFNYLNGSGAFFVDIVKEEDKNEEEEEDEYVPYEDKIQYAVYNALNKHRFDVLIDESDKDYIVKNWDIVTYYKTLLASNPNNFHGSSSYITIPLTIPLKTIATDILRITEEELIYLLKIENTVLAGGAGYCILRSQLCGKTIPLSEHSDIDIFSLDSNHKLEHMALRFSSGVSKDKRVNYASHGDMCVHSVGSKSTTMVQFIRNTKSKCEHCPELIRSKRRLLDAFDMNICKVAIFNNGASIMTTMSTYIDVYENTYNWNGLELANTMQCPKRMNHKRIAYGISLPDEDIKEPRPKSSPDYRFDESEQENDVRIGKEFDIFRIMDDAESKNGRGHSYTAMRQLKSCNHESKNSVHFPPMIVTQAWPNDQICECRVINYQQYGLPQFITVHTLRGESLAELKKNTLVKVYGTLRTQKSGEKVLISSDIIKCYH